LINIGDEDTWRFVVEDYDLVPRQQWLDYVYIVLGPPF
jgi:hypothetical protein